MINILKTILILLPGALIFMVVLVKEEQSDLQKIKYEKALNIMLDKYQWKSDRLKVYTDLVYNSNGGVIYEKK